MEINTNVINTISKLFYTPIFFSESNNGGGIQEGGGRENFEKKMQTSHIPSQNQSTYQILSESNNGSVLKTGGEGTEFRERGGIQGKGSPNRTII